MEQDLRVASKVFFSVQKLKISILTKSIQKEKLVNLFKSLKKKKKRIVSQQLGLLTGEKSFVLRRAPL